MADFAHLHVHTEFSLLDGLSKIPKLVNKAKALGMNHLAMTDHGGMYGAIKFYKQCTQENINPIIGCEMYVAKRSYKDKEAGQDTENFHLTVLAKDYEGYTNLMKLVTQSYLEGFYYRPRIDKDLLAKYSKGLLALSGCSSSEVSRALIEGNLKEAKKIADSYRQILGKENYYLEIQRHLFDSFKSAHPEGGEIFSDLERMAQGEKKIITGVKKLNHQTGVEIVATNDLHYISLEDAQAQDAVVCIQTGKVLSEIKRLRMIDSPTYYLKSHQEMSELFADIPHSISNSIKIAQKVNIKIALNQVAFPKYNVGKVSSAEEYLNKLCYERITKVVEKVTPEIRKRLDYELSVITKKGYSTYFLVVADFVNWARDKGIISTTRGSASGSLVSFALGITTVNPLFFKLPFERFLNLYRPTLPDIDVDFADNRRDEVIEYVKNKYGTEKLGQIGTFGTMMAKAAVRDVARVMGWPYAKADRIAKLIPIGSQGFPMSIETAKRINKELGQLYETDKEVKELLDLAQKVEGNVRHVSVHAAGVVISPTPLTDFTPLQKETTGEKIITQYDMHDIEETGLVKMDFLGIRNLSILGEAVTIVEKEKGIKIDLTSLPFDDNKAFKILAKGETMGLFQLGGAGMTRYLKELKPNSIFDIMAMISLFRPGPMNSIPEFIERKINSKKIKYFDKRMEDYLKESYGVIVYQDDVLLTAINIAGYNWEEADKFRKAMGKKIPSEMARQKEKFVSGAVKNGLPRPKAEELFKLIEPFAAYGFNKAHAASYAIIAYQTAYMKANYTVEFMTAVMSAESDDPDKIASAVAECSRMGILVLPPHINKSKTGFTIERNKGKQSIRFGLSAIKNVGKAAIEAIITERKKSGDFSSVDDFIRRVNLSVVNRKTLESLIKAGALDIFGTRNALLRVIEDIRASGQSLSKVVAEGQGSLFSDEEIKKNSDQAATSTKAVLDSIEEAPKDEILSWERELLGFYLTEHPLTKYSGLLSKVVSHNIDEIEILNLSSKKIKIAGIISSMRTTLTKVRQEEMCFIKLQDLTGSMEVIVFPRVYSQAKSLLAPDKIVVVSGKLETEDSPIVIAESVTSLDNAKSDNYEGIEDNLEISIPPNADRILLSEIYEVIKSSPGSNLVHLILPTKDGTERRFSVPFGASRTQELEKNLEKLGCKVVN